MKSYRFRHLHFLQKRFHHLERRDLLWLITKNVKRIYVTKQSKFKLFTKYPMERSNPMCTTKKGILLLIGNLTKQTKDELTALIQHAIILTITRYV